MPMQSADIIEWRPHAARHVSICAYTTAVGEAAALRATLEHNANWAVAHGATFSLFRLAMAAPGLHSQWEKVHATKRMLERPECAWSMHIDADAIVVDVTRSPAAILSRLEEESVPAHPAIFATCNSPLGRGYDCDVFCCGRAQSRGTECVGLHDLGPESPYPCMINSGVYFVRRGEASRQLVRSWEAKQSVHPEIFGEQASLNELKSAHPELIEVVGGQVMNSHTAFESRMLEAGGVGRTAYDIALRLTSGYQPGPFHDARLNASAYRRTARSWFGRPPGGDLKSSLQEDVGACARDPRAFICHPFARPIHMKRALAEAVAHDEARRAQLTHLLRTQQRVPYRSIEEASNATARMDHSAWVARVTATAARRVSPVPTGVEGRRME